jgi:uncharacterized membrane protein YeaQ/YmgE (transglycosylase-associated protein family)
VSTPDPVPKRSGWVPTTENAAGGLFGGYVAQLIVASWGAYVPAHPMSIQTVVAVTGICTVLANHLFRNGGGR